MRCTGAKKRGVGLAGLRNGLFATVLATVGISCECPDTPQEAMWIAQERCAEDEYIGNGVAVQGDDRCWTYSTPCVKIGGGGDFPTPPIDQNP